MRNYHIKIPETEPGSPWQNQAEAGIRGLKCQTRYLLHQTNSLKNLWDYACMLPGLRSSLKIYIMLQMEGPIMK